MEPSGAYSILASSVLADSPQQKGTDPTCTISNDRYKDFGRALDQLRAPTPDVASTKPAQREKIDEACVPYFG